MPSPAPARCSSPSETPYFKGIQPYSPESFKGVHSYSPNSFGHPSRDYQFVGMPLEPPPLPHNYEPDEEEDTGPSTAEIIANQSQDYIDEKLAEYQATIYLLQGE
ncbi:hypothetical protein JTB14_035911 [Gonioctena quinquepunctata]|nr:hypothetical protein JTB14_035911 [Gonioctena quinquepunctata]